jgi:uncharacterized protein YpmS
MEQVMAEDKQQESQQPVRAPRKAQRKQHPTTMKLKRPVNLWKWAFIVLCGLLIGGSLAVVHRVTQSVATTSTVKLPENKGNVMSIKLTKEQLNRLINNYLKHYLKDSNMKYSLTIGDHAVLKGNFKFFGATVGFGIQCDPYVQTNGNILLKATKINVGTLSVPIDYVMSYVAKNYDLPKMVSVNSKEQSIVLRLNQFDLGNGLHVRAQRIDLSSDVINLTGYLAK